MRGLLFALLISTFFVQAQLPIILHETFDKNTFGWFENETETNKVVLRDGKYFFQAPEGGWMTYVAPYINPNKEFSLQATFTQLNGLDDNGIGFIWGYDGKEEMNNFTFTSNGYFRIWCADKTLNISAAGQTPPPVLAPGVPVDYLFPTGSGLLIFHVDPLKVADFDAIVARIKDALSKADTATRKLQATNWLIYKSAEKPGESAVYLFLFDPAVTGANYDPLLMLAEILPAEVQPIYERMKTAVLRIERMGLTKIR